jgi:signal transduction histidine kinase
MHNLFRPSAIRWISLILLWVFVRDLPAQDLVVYHPEGTREAIRPAIFRDPSHLLRVDTLIQHSEAFPFNIAETPYPSFGNDPSNWWLKFRLKNQLTDTQEVVIHLNRKNIDIFHLYRIDRAEAISLGLVGAQGPDPSHAQLTNGYQFRVQLPPGEHQFIGSARNQIGSMHLNLSVHDPAGFEVFVRQLALLFGAFCGVMALSVFFSLVLFFQYRDHLYLLYLAYIVNLLLRESYNYSADLGWMPIFQRNASSLLIGCTFALFYRRFIHLKMHLPRMDKLVVAYAVFIGLGALAVWQLAQRGMGEVLQYVFPVLDIANLIFTLLALALSIYLFKKSPRARITLVAFFPLAIGFTAILLRNMDVIPNYPLISQAVMLGFVFEVTVFTFAFLYWHQNLTVERKLLEARLALERKEKQLAIQEAEQRIKDNIARDLHDDIAASMSGIRILSQVAQKEYTEQAAETAPLLDQISQSAQNALESISDLIWAVKPNPDYLNDLADRIRSQTSTLLDASPILYRFDIERNLPIRQLNLEEKRNIYLIFKEALNNALKYSNCKQVKIGLAVKDDQLLLTIRDDGRGFATDQIPLGSGNGLNNMRVRAEKIKAACKIISSPGTGTSVLVSLPLNKQKQ